MHDQSYNHSWAAAHMRTIILFMMACFATRAVHATTQIPEVLIYAGTTNDMYSTPLETLFSADNPKPRLFYEHPSSTACWRGYVGTWKIEADELYLVALREGDPRTDAIHLNRVNPQWVSPVKATWFSGTIRIGKGKVLMGGMGFSETRARDVFLEIKAGKVVSTREIDNTRQKEKAEPDGATNGASPRR